VIDVLTLVAALGLGVLAFTYRGPAPAPAPARKVRTPPAAIIDMAPRGASLVVAVDVERLRKSAIGNALLGENKSLPGVEGVTEACGYDPSIQVRELVLVAPGKHLGGAASSGDFGIVATGPFESQRLSACAGSVIRRRGGSAAVSRAGSFTTVRDPEQQGPELAVRNEGPVLLGSAAILQNLIDVSDGRAPGLAADDPHRKLRARLSGGATFVASLVLHEGWLEELAGTSLTRLSPLSTLRTAALRIDLGARLELRMLAGCTARDACAETAVLLERLVRSEVGELLEREFGPEGMKRLRIQAKDTEIEASFWLEEREASALAGRVIEALTRPDEEPESDAEPVEPDEIVRPP
jgi:hypothetical protein